MQRHGLNTRGNSLRGWPILAMLLGIVLLILNFLKKQITYSKPSNMEILLYNYFIAFGFTPLLARCFVAQAAHETADFTSTIFKTNNNICGMKYAGQQFATGEKNGYANYLNIQQSAQDLAQWYNKRRNKLFSLPLTINSIDDYVSFLKNGNYFEDTISNYLRGCKFFYNKYFPA